MKLDCHMGLMQEGLDHPGALTDLSDFVAQQFIKASNGDIELRCIGPQLISNPLPVGTVTAFNLHKALAKMTHNPLAGTISNIGILFAGTYARYKSALGIMFDRGFVTPDDPNLAETYTAIPREGCAVFLDAISMLRGSGEEYVSEVRYSTVHELGHVFNLQHKTDSLNFMNISQHDKGYGPDAFRFDEEQKSWLSQCSTNNNVRPGGSKFNDGSNMNRPDAQQTIDALLELDLSIHCQPREFWRFEPIQLEIMLGKSINKMPYFEVPDELDPGYKRFRIMIENPLGERRLYKPTEYFCGIGNMIKITADSPFHRDIPIFGQSGGYTFNYEGVHGIWAEFDTGHGVLRSNKLDILIKPERGSDQNRDLARQHLTKQRIASLLYYREDSTDGEGLNYLNNNIESLSEISSAAEIYYTLGRVMLNHYGKIKNSKTEINKAADYLKMAIDHAHLGFHRRLKSQELLNSLP